MSDPPIITMEGLFSLLLLLVLSLVAVFFHLIRIYFNSPVDFSMDWNLFLSWIPLIVAFLADNFTKRFGKIPVWLILLSLVWLAFFPNAPYMITDLAHLTVDYQRDLTWHDTIMLFFLCGSEPLQRACFIVLDTSFLAACFQQERKYGFSSNEPAAGWVRCIFGPGKAYEQLGYTA